MMGRHGTDRQSVLRQIEAAWKHQARRPTAAEVDTWVDAGRPQGPRDL